jgi:hypothetical protein
MKGQVSMLIHKPDTDFDKLINAAKHKVSQSPHQNIKFHRQHQSSRPDHIPSSASLPMDAPAPRPLTVNFAHFIKHPDTSGSHELADSKFIIGPPPANPSSEPSPNNKRIENLGNKRWKYQGKTYKEEPIGRS